MYQATIAAALLILVLSPGCSLFKKHPKVSLPSHPLVLPKAKPHPPVPDLDAPPALEPNAPDTEEVAAIHIPTPEIPPRPPVPKPRRQRHDVTPKDEQEEPADSEEAEEPAEEAPQLVQLLTAEQRRQYDQLIDQDLSQAQKSLQSVVGRNLTPEEIESSNLIKAFIRQAKEAREQDPMRARSLAERASLLAQHLEKSVR